MNRFELEQAIMSCWNTSDDIKILSESVIEDHAIEQDKIANTLIGIESLHNIRMERLFSIFEEMIRCNKIH